MGVVFWKVRRGILSRVKQRMLVALLEKNDDVFVARKPLL